MGESKEGEKLARDPLPKKAEKSAPEKDGKKGKKRDGPLKASEEQPTGAVKSSEEKENEEATETGGNSTPPNQGSTNFTWILFVVVAVAVAVLAFVANNSGSLPSFKTQENTLNKTERNNKFVKEVNSIIGMLKNTESNLKFVNRSLTIYINNEEHEKPAIFLLLGTNSSACQLCFCMWKFVDALHNYYEENPPILDSGYIPAEELASRDDNDKKLFIENSVEEVVRSRKHLILFEDIDKFSNSSLGKVHAYLDHENAPHKDVVYILTSVIADEVNPKFETTRDLSRIATKHFDDQWSEYDQDHRRALMGRMTSVIGLIHKGKLNEVIKPKDIDKTIMKKCQNKCNK